MGLEKSMWETTQRERSCAMDRLSKTGEVLHTGECQLKTGPYVYRYIDSNGKVKYTQSASLEHLRWKESFIDQGLPVAPTPKYSTSGELL